MELCPQASLPLDIPHEQAVVCGEQRLLSLPRRQAGTPTGISLGGAQKRYGDLSKIVFNILLIFILTISPMTPALATAMDSDNFHIESGGFSVTSGSDSSSNFSIEDIVGSSLNGTFTSDGYSIQTGLPYLSGTQPFTFSLSNTDIDFGVFTANQPSIRSVNALVGSGSSSGYQLLVAENQAPTGEDQASIPDTKCDNRNQPCTAVLATLWTKPSVYGFGINLSGTGVASDFQGSRYYRPVSNLSLGQSPTLLMSSEKNNVTNQAVINLKINVSGNQPAGNYQNDLYFIALPGY